MHIIHSNPWGFRIHSPFIYQVVTRGLYRKSGSKENIFSFPGSFSGAERKCATQLISLIRFLQPENVVISGGNDPVHQWIVSNWQILKNEKKEGGKMESIQCSRIVLHDGWPQSLTPEHDTDAWVITGLNKKEIKTRHKILPVGDEVRVSLKSKLTVILFFHPLLQKEYYIIHRWFYI